MSRRAVGLARLVCLWLAVAVSTGCLAISMPARPAPARLGVQQSELLAGTARVDVTYPPGISTFGHALDARVAAGYWGRSYCRVFYFRTAAGQELALVPCELPATSALLQREVSELLRQSDGGLEPAQVVVTAVHTHAGVGHFFGAGHYTGQFSTRFPGFDERLMRDLAGRIARGVQAARKAARPAALAWHHRDDFWCLSRNRSLDAYQRNRPPSRPQAPAARPPLDRPQCLEGRPDLAAVDPQLSVLEVAEYDVGRGRAIGPIGSISFYAMHPTVLPNANKLFGADVAGVVSRYVERRLRLAWCDASSPACTSERDPLHGVVNTNAGDVSPIWSRGDVTEALRIGRDVGRFVWKAHGLDCAGPAGTKPAGAQPQCAQPNPRPRFGLAYLEDDMAAAEFVDAEGTARATCRKGLIGQGAARGASDHPTSLEPIPLFSTQPAPQYSSEDCHAPKRPLLGWLGKLLAGEGAFPNVVPLSVWVVEDTVATFVPAEMTVTAGRRLRRRVLDAIGGADSPRRAIVGGLANEYVEYAATREEYQLQHYEGASTLYGPGTAGYFAHRAALLARWLWGDPGVDRSLERFGLRPGEARAITFRHGPPVDRLQSSFRRAEARRHLGTCSIRPGAVDPGATPSPPIVCTYWWDDGPLDVGLHQTGGSPWVQLLGADGEPLAGCLGGGSPCDPRGFVDDRGLEFRTRIHDWVGRGWVWSTAFSPSVETWAGVGGQSVRIFAGAGPARIASRAFSAGALPPACSAKQVRLCLDGERTDEWEGLVPPLACPSRAFASRQGHRLVRRPASCR